MKSLYSQKLKTTISNVEIRKDFGLSGNDAIVAELDINGEVWDILEWFSDEDPTKLEVADSQITFMLQNDEFKSMFKHVDDDVCIEEELRSMLQLMADVENYKLSK